MGSNISNRTSEDEFYDGDILWLDTTPPSSLQKYFDGQSFFDKLHLNGSRNNFSYHSKDNDALVPTRTIGELVVGTLTFIAITLMTIVGNILVILSVLTYRPLNRVQNYFLVSLAAADLAVAVLVTPFHVVKFLVGEWIFGLAFCQMWLTCDILCCTASILNLCAIALDRYWAIHDPINYASKRTLKLVLGMIAVVWVLSLLISVPPLIGWNDWSQDHLETTCELTTQREFVVFSASGSFFIPLIVMTAVYAKIFYAARQRLRSKRRSIRGLSVGSVADSEPGGDREPNAQNRNNSRRVTQRRQHSTRARVGGAGRMSSSGNTTYSSAADCSNVTGHSVATTSTYCDERVPVLIRKNTGLLCTVEENNASSTGGECVTVLGADSLVTTSIGKETTAPANQIRSSEKAFLLKEQNGASTLFVVTPSDDDNVFKPDVAARPPKPLRHQSLHRFVNRLSQRSSLRSSANSRRSEPCVLGLPRRDDSIRTSISSHIAVEKYMKEKERISVTKEKKAAKTLAVIMGVFVLCWLPFFVTYVIKPFISPARWIMHLKVEEAITWLGYINSAINPVIYTIFNMDFRRAFQKFLCPFRSKKKSTQSGISKTVTSAKTVH